MTSLGPEHRRSTRRRMSGAIAWSAQGGPDRQTGWLLEASDDGLAFAWRGAAAPPEGSIINVDFPEPSDIAAPAVAHAGTNLAVVRHQTVVHEDLHVLGAQWRRTRVFPPAASVIVEVAVLPKRLALPMSAPGVDRRPALKL